jgi:hypothetical protein
MEAIEIYNGMARAVEAAKPAQEYCLLWIPHWSACMTKAEWSGWMQAIGSVLAIYVAVRIANRQHEKQGIEKNISDAKRNMQYAKICNELCLAAESIARFGLSEWELAAKPTVQADKEKFFYHLDRATSTYRLENLQSSIIPLLQKEMPSELMATIFSLQKNLAIYSSTISMHHEYDVRFQFLDFYKAQDDLKDEIKQLKEAIESYKNRLQEEVSNNG